MHSSFIVLSEVPLENADAMRALEYLGLSPDAEADADESIAAGPGDTQQDSRVGAAAPAAGPRVDVVVPADTERSVIAEVIDSLGLLDLQAAWDAIAERAQGERTRRRAANEAQAVLASVTRAFESVGCIVDGSVVEDDPIPSIRERLQQGCSLGAVVVYSDPQLLEETFAQDWAHRVEDHLSVAVLHLYPGTGRIGTA